MAADVGVLQRLPKIVAPAVAREMAYTGERLAAERALAVGLVNAVLPDTAALLAHTLAWRAAIAAKSPLAIAGSKLALNYARDHGTAAALEQMATLQSAIFDTGEMAEAIAAWTRQARRAFRSVGRRSPGPESARAARASRGRPSATIGDRANRRPGGGRARLFGPGPKCLMAFVAPKPDANESAPA